MSNQRMTREEYQQAQEQVLLVAGMTERIDIERMLSAIGTAETYGPIMDPTLYRKSITNLERIKRLAQLLLPVKKEMEKQREEAGV